MSDANLAKAEIIFDRIQKDIVLWDKKPVTIAAARDQNEADGLSVVLLAGALQFDPAGTRGLQ